MFSFRNIEADIIELCMNAYYCTYRTLRDVDARIDKVTKYCIVVKAFVRALWSLNVDRSPTDIGLNEIGRPKWEAIWSLIPLHSIFGIHSPAAYLQSVWICIFENNKTEMYRKYPFPCFHVFKTLFINLHVPEADRNFLKISTHTPVST